MPQLWVSPEELEDESNSPYAYEACRSASYILWAFSGRKYNGIRVVTERYECPCRSLANPLSSGQAISPYLDGDGGVYNAVGGSENCGCSGTVAGRHVRLRLRGSPVRGVKQVKTPSGEILDPNTYSIVNSSLLQLNGANAEVCGLEVTYMYGTPIPTSGRRSARSLAREFAKGWAGKEDCMLPDRVTNVSRQGISFTVLDEQAFIDDLRTGLYEIDLFLRAANPDKARKPARVFSPDVPKAYRTTVGMPVQIGPLDWSVTPGTPYTWTVDLAQSGAEILLQTDLWSPQGQISTWNGAVLLEFDASRFQISDGELTVNLTATETSQILSSGSSAAWDLYAVNANDGFTVVHAMTSSIWNVS